MQVRQLARIGRERCLALLDKLRSRYLSIDIDISPAEEEQECCFVLPTNAPSLNDMFSESPRLPKESSLSELRNVQRHVRAYV